jgi:hypothetical protein
MLLSGGDTVQDVDEGEKADPTQLIPGGVELSVKPQMDCS